MAGEHILIVDDEPAIRSTLRDVLEDEGYRVSAVGSGVSRSYSTWTASSASASCARLSAATTAIGSPT